MRSVNHHSAHNTPFLSKHSINYKKAPSCGGARRALRAGAAALDGQEDRRKEAGRPDSEYPLRLRECLRHAAIGFRFILSPRPAAAHGALCAPGRRHWTGKGIGGRRPAGRNGGGIMYSDFNFAERLASLREQRGVSARDMSLSLGQNPSYINKLENGKAMPSMEVFSTSATIFTSLRPSFLTKKRKPRQSSGRSPKNARVSPANRWSTFSLSSGPCRARISDFFCAGPLLPRFPLSYRFRKKRDPASSQSARYATPSTTK